MSDLPQKTGPVAAQNAQQAKAPAVNAQGKAQPEVEPFPFSVSVGTVYDLSLIHI